MARFVLVHGGFSGEWIWLPLMDSLRAAGHLVEAFDLPGMGRSFADDARRIFGSMQLPEIESLVQNISTAVGHRDF